MNENVFRFKLDDIREIKKGDKHFCIIVAYCSFGYSVSIFTSPDKAFKLSEIVEKEKNHDISKYIKVYYDNKKQCFAYVIKF